MKHLSGLFFLCLLSFSTQAAIKGEEVSYKAGDATMKGYLAYDDAISGKRPAVLVVHEWWGHNDYARMRALKLAEMGYTALAVDMYGDGKTAAHPDDAGKFSSAVTAMPTNVAPVLLPPKPCWKITRQLPSMKLPPSVTALVVAWY